MRTREIHMYAPIPSTNTLALLEPGYMYAHLCMSMSFSPAEVEISMDYIDALPMSQKGIRFKLHPCHSGSPVERPYIRAANVQECQRSRQYHAPSCLLCKRMTKIGLVDIDLQSWDRPPLVGVFVSPVS